MSIFDKILRSGEGKKLKALQALVPDISALEPEMERLSDAAPQAKPGEFRNRLDHGQDHDDIIIEDLTVPREASKRLHGTRPHHVQLTGGAYQPVCRTATVKHR